MSLLTSVAAKGSGKVGVLLPNGVTSARWTEFDPEFLKDALLKAGVSASDILIQNAGDDTQQFTQAQSEIADGATVLLLRDLDSGVGIRIDQYAKQHSVSVVDYDTLTVGGSGKYYVSFDNVAVGKLIGTGFQACVTAWHVADPSVLVMRGDPTDNNAALFADGYLDVLNPLFKSGTYKLLGQPAGTWTPSVSLTEFQQAFTADKSLNAAVIPNDENAGPIVSFLQSQHIPPMKFPLTGQDATLVGLQNILSGYQCGTVYKPIYLEAQGAVAEALYARANLAPPSSLINGSTTDPQTHRSVPSVLLTPEWVTSANMNTTVVADNFVPASQLCAGKYAADCQSAGINP